MPNGYRWLILIAVIAIGAFGVWYVAVGPGVAMTIINKGSATMAGVRVLVTGRSYTLDDIPAGARSTVRVHPTGDSSVLIEYDEAGTHRVLTVDCYLSSGDRGWISVDLENGQITRKDLETKGPL